MRHDVCAAAELPAGSMVEAVIGARPVVVARTHAGRLYALSGRCLHHGAPLARGRLLTAVEGDRTGEYRQSTGHDVLKCPWHGYEYDLSSGAVLFDERRRLRVFAVREHDGRIVVETREAACAA
jgi:3-phenylpropionate/trans-cinnamate dioxygenase ferredoxin subunit